MRAPTSLHEIRAAQAAAVANEPPEVSTQSQGGGRKPPNPPGSTDQPEPEPSRPTNHPSESKSPWAGWSIAQTYEAQSGSAAITAGRINQQINAGRSESADKISALDAYEEKSQPDIDQANEIPPDNSIGGPTPPDEEMKVQEVNDYFDELEQEGNIEPDPQLPDAPHRPDFGSLKLEHSQEQETSISDSQGQSESPQQSEPRFFSERHPSSRDHGMEH